MGPYIQAIGLAIIVSKTGTLVPILKPSESTILKVIDQSNARDILDKEN